jgi:hypothetical protein
VPNAINIIYAEWSSGTAVEYSVTQLVFNNLAEAIATNHKARVEADGGIIPSYPLLISEIQTLIDNYNITNETQFYNKVAVFLKPNVAGYKIGTGTAITLGQACSKLYSLNADADVTQATVANQPLLLVKGTDQYYFSPRVSGNEMRTTTSPVTAYNNATDTLRVTAKIFMNSQTTTSFDYLFSCGAAGNFAISNRNGSKVLRVRGSANATDSSLYTPSATVPHWVRYTMNTTQVIYEWSADGITWTNIGTVARPALGAFSTTQTIGNTGATPLNATSIYYVLFENVTAVTSLTFTPNLYNRAYLENGWYETNGTTSWSNVQDTAVTGLKGVLVDETQVIGNGLAYKLSQPSLVISQPYTAYAVQKRLGTGVIYALGASSQLSNDATNDILNNGTALNRGNTSKNRLLITAVCDGASSSLNVNNGTATSGNAGANNGTYLDVLANNTVYGNFVFNSLIIIND